MVDRFVGRGASGWRVFWSLVLFAVPAAAQISRWDAAAAGCGFSDASLRQSGCDSLMRPPGPRGPSLPDPSPRWADRTVARGHSGAQRIPAAAEASVSMARLRHAPPPKAAREMEKANGFLRRGERTEAIRHLEKAIEIHPSFIEARNNLGVQYIQTGRINDAMAQFQRTLELDPSSSRTYVNLSVALHILGDLEAARSAAARAVELAPRAPEAQLALGTVLLEGGNSDSAVEHLRGAVHRFPKAGLLAAEALIETGRYDEAQAEIRRFLDGVR